MRRLSFLAVLILPLIAVAGIFGYSDQTAGVMNTAASYLFALFRDKTFPLILAAAILSAGVGLALAYLVFLVIPIVVSLQGKRKWISRFSDAKTFAADFDSVSQRLERDRLIGHAWSEFRETVLRPDTEPPIVQNTVRPHTFINSQYIQEHTLALRFMPHLPNYFVGVGLLLTFVGLIAALNSATRTVGADIDTAISGLQDLLNAATFKFWTSVAGLGMSIILSVVFRLYSQWIEGSFVGFCDAVERKMQFQTPQGIFAEMREIEQEQLSETKKINSEVAFTIGSSINENLNQQLPQALRTALEPMTEEINRTSEAIVNRSNEGVDAMVDKFANTLESGSGQHMKEISQTLENLQSTLGALQGSMDSSGNEFARRMAEGAERLDSTMRDMSSAITELVGQLRSQVDEAGSSMTSQLEETLKRISEQSEAMAQNLANQGQSASQAFAENVHNAARSLQDSADANAQASAQTVQELSKQLEATVSSMDAGVSKLASRMQEVDTSLGNQAQAFENIVSQEKAVSQSLETASNQLRVGVQPWQEAGRTLAQATQQAENTITNAGKQLGEAIETAERLSKSLGDVSENLHQSWESYQNRFEKVDEDLERAFKQITESVESQQRRVQEFVKELDQSFTTAVDRLSGTISNISETTEDLQEILERWVQNGSNNDNAGDRTR